MSSSEKPAAGVRSETSMTLLNRAKANEAGAWERLVSLYSPLVSYWRRAAGVPDGDNDDLLQEVFLAASTGLANFRREQVGDTFRGWLRGITRNVLLTYFRRRSQEPIAEGGAESQQRIDNFADPHVNLPDEDPPEQTSAVYHRALEMVRNEFEEKTWRMFWQVAVEDLPVAEVSERFGVTKATVRKAKSRVLFRLKQEVGDIFE